MNPSIRKYFFAAAAFAGAILFFRYLLPLVLPFLLGAGLAVAAEPLVHFLNIRLRLRRGFATGIGITMAFSFLALAVMILCAFLIRELRILAGILPELEEPLRAGLNTASHWLTDLASQAPGELGTVLTRNVDSFFSGSDAFLSRAANFLLKLASGVLSHVPDSALALATGVISSFMISAKLPKIRRWLREKLPPAKFEPVISALSRLKAALGGWLKAQATLSLVTYALTALAFFLLRVPHALLWALLVALVDAFPILGTGTVLVPWSIVAFLQGDRVLSLGLLVLYASAALIRSVLEPRLLGKQLGLDPLVTLMALYAGYRHWGIGGMIVAPIMAVAVTQLLAPQADG